MDSIVNAGRNVSRVLLFFFFSSRGVLVFMFICYHYYLAPLGVVGLVSDLPS